MESVRNTKCFRQKVNHGGRVLHCSPTLVPSQGVGKGPRIQKAESTPILGCSVTFLLWGNGKYKTRNERR